MLKSLLEVARQWSREKFAVLSLKPRSHVRILIYRTWTQNVNFLYLGCAWEVGNPVMLHIGESATVSCMTAIHGRLWCGLGCNAVIVNTTTLEVEVRIKSVVLVKTSLHSQECYSDNPEFSFLDIL